MEQHINVTFSALPDVAGFRGSQIMAAVAVQEGCGSMQDAVRRIIQQYPNATVRLVENIKRPAEVGSAWIAVNVISGEGAEVLIIPRTLFAYWLTHFSGGATVH